MLGIRASMEKNRPALALLPKILLVMIAFLLMVVTSTVYCSKMLYRHLEQDTIDVLTKVKLQIESELSAQNLSALLISQSVREMILNNTTEEELSEYLQNITDYIVSESNILSLSNNGVYGFFDIYGDKFLAGASLPVPDNYKPKEHLWYQAAVMANGDLAITTAQDSLLQNSGVITYSCRFFDNEGNPLGVLSIDTSLDSIKRHISEITIAEYSYGLLLNENLDVLIHPSQELIGKNANDIDGIFNNELLADNGFIKYEGQNYAGIKTIASACRLENGWILCVKISKTQYFHELTNMKRSISILGVILATLLSVVLISIDSQKRRANERTQIMLDSMPLGVSFLDKSFRSIDCNQALVNLFELSDKQEYLERRDEFSAQYQPCGKLSEVKKWERIGIALTQGYDRFEWMHQSPGGELIPCEKTLVRAKHQNEHFVLVYTRDLRELKAAIAEIHKAEEDLRLALAVAEDSAKAKSEFLGNMSHELRTPMNGILGFLRIALQSETFENQRKSIIQAENSAKDLLKMIDNVLDFTEIENNKTQMNAAPFKLPALFGDISNTYVLPTKAKGLTLSFSYPAELPDEMVGDSQKLKQVLCHLIDNAIKFTDKGKISVRASIKHLSAAHIDLEFYVRDTGIGLLPEQMDSLFTPFWQADTTATRKYGGTGLGLALSKYLVKLPGGKIWAESVHEEGSTFYFTTRFRLSGNSESTPQTHDNTPVLPGAEEITENPCTSGGLLVLLVEDVEINQIIAEELLVNLGFAVDIANNGQEALDMLTQKNYSVVLMDIQMPVMDGLTATKKIRQIAEYKNLPIIAVSAHSLPADKEKSLDYGMNDHITKPLDIIILRTTLSKWLSPASE